MFIILYGYLSVEQEISARQRILNSFQGYVRYKALQVEKLITEKSKLRGHITKRNTQIMGNKNYLPKPSGLFAIGDGNPHAMVTLTL